MAGDEFPGSNCLNSGGQPRIPSAANPDAPPGGQPLLTDTHINAPDDPLDPGGDEPVPPLPGIPGNPGASGPGTSGSAITIYPPATLGPLATSLATVLVRWTGEASSTCAIAGNLSVSDPLVALWPAYEQLPDDLTGGDGNGIADGVGEFVDGNECWYYSPNGVDPIDDRQIFHCKLVGNCGGINVYVNGQTLTRQLLLVSNSEVDGTPGPYYQASRYIYDALTAEASELPHNADCYYVDINNRAPANGSYHWCDFVGLYSDLVPVFQDVSSAAVYIGQATAPSPFTSSITNDPADPDIWGWVAQAVTGFTDPTYGADTVGPGNYVIVVDTSCAFGLYGAANKGSLPDQSTMYASLAYAGSPYAAPSFPNQGLNRAGEIQAIHDSPITIPVDASSDSPPTPANTATTTVATGPGNTFGLNLDFGSTVFSSAHFGGTPPAVSVTTTNTGTSASLGPIVYSASPPANPLLGGSLTGYLGIPGIVTVFCTDPTATSTASVSSADFDLILGATASGVTSYFELSSPPVLTTTVSINQWFQAFNFNVTFRYPITFTEPVKLWLMWSPYANYFTTTTFGGGCYAAPGAAVVEIRQVATLIDS